jgi:hypothetical protein
MPAQQGLNLRLKCQINVDLYGSLKKNDDTSVDGENTIVLIVVDCYYRLLVASWNNTHKTRMIKNFFGSH